MVLIREEGDKWSSKVRSLEAPLRKGLRMRMEARAITYAESDKSTHSGPVHCQLIKWEYRITDVEDAELVLVVREANPDGSDRNLPMSDSTGMWALGLAVLVGIILAAFFTDWYFFPEHLWTLVGHYARPLGIVSLLILFASVIPSRLGLRRRRPGFTTVFWSALLFWTGMALAFLWFHFTQQSWDFKPSDDAYARFGHEIVERLKAERWPLVLAALPWAALVFKVLGLEIAEKTSETILEATKSKE